MAGAGTGGAPVTPGAGGSVGANQFELYQSGTRIKARVGKTADGAKSFQGWWDAQRNEACDFQSAPDGKLRCLPAAAVGGGMFSDSACTRPVVQVVCGVGEMPKYGRVFEIAGGLCSAVQRDSMYTLGGRVMAAPFLRNPMTRACESVGVGWESLQQSGAYYHTGDVVPWDQFQEMTVTVE